MASETFKGAVERLHKAGTFNFSALLTFVNNVESSTGNTFSGGFYKCAGRERGKGLLPRTMKNPVTNENFIFPMLNMDRQKGEHITVTVVEPKCPKCGSDMERRKRRDGTADFFGCSRYPGCRGACDAYADVTGSGSPQSGEEPKVEVEVKLHDRTALINRIVTLVERARKVVEDHNMTLPIGYRTTQHLAKLAIIIGCPDEAWKLWVDGRVSDVERAKFDAAGLPAGSPKPVAVVKDQPSWYGTMAAVLDAGLPVFLVGGAGTGKTRFAKWYAARREVKLEMVVGSGDVAGRELWVARRDASKGETKTVPGPAARACADGSVLLLDEIDGFDSNSLLPMNAVLNGDQRLSVPVLGELEVNPEVRIIAAANTNGRSKDRTYNARNRLDGAFLNRFAVVCQTRYERNVDTLCAAESIEDVLKALGK